MSSTDPFGLIGQILDGQFRVDKFVGEGGFSVVYRGHHVGLQEPIAIKCLKLPIALGSALVESFVKRFRDESRLHYRLSQGNLFIVRTLAAGTTMAPATGALVPYMVLEWLEGRSLAADLEVRRAYGDTGRSLEEAVKLLDSAVDGLAYAHAQGVVHRDVNPGNLFMTATSQGSRLKVLDFGVAKVISDHTLSLGPRAQTIGQIRIFSPQYAAPEQFDDKLGPIGTWTDVYSLALIVLEVLRDVPAIEGEHLGDFASRALDPLRRPTPRTLGVAVPDETEAIFAGAVTLDPKARPSDVGEFWGSLKAAMRRDAAAGNAAYADAPKPQSTADPAASSKNTSPGQRVQPGRTLSIEQVPIPVRPSQPASPPPPSVAEMPPETSRMADAPTPPQQQQQQQQQATGYAPQRATPPPPPGAPSVASPSMAMESAVPPTPPATEVIVPAPPPPVPNVFEQSAPARTGSYPSFTRGPGGPDTLTGSANAYPPSLLVDPPGAAQAAYAPPLAQAAYAPQPGQAAYAPPPAPVVFVAPAPAPGLVGQSVPSREVTSPMPQVAMGTVMMARPSPSALPPAAPPTPATAASQPPPDAVPFAAPPRAPITAPLVESLDAPDSEEKPTRIGSGALDVFAQLYTAPVQQTYPPPPQPTPHAWPAPVFAPAPQAAAPTVTTRPKGNLSFVLFVIVALLLAFCAAAYIVYTTRTH